MLIASKKQQCINTYLIYLDSLKKCFLKQAIFY